MNTTTRDINDLLDDLFKDTELQVRFGQDPAAVMQGYDLSDDQRNALLAGDSDALLALGLDQRHVRQMRIAW